MTRGETPSDGEGKPSIKYCCQSKVDIKGSYMKVSCSSKVVAAAHAAAKQQQETMTTTSTYFFCAAARQGARTLVPKANQNRESQLLLL